MKTMLTNDALEFGFSQIKDGNIYFTDELLQFMHLDIKKDGDFEIAVNLQRDIKKSFIKQFVYSMKLPSDNFDYWINQLLEFQKNIGELVSFGKFDSRGAFRIDGSKFISCYDGYSTAKELLNYIKGFNEAFTINQRKINDIIAKEPYYQKQIKGLSSITSIQLFNEEEQYTRHLDLNKECAAAIIDFLQKKYL